jgi:hypothetical protein
MILIEITGNPLISASFQSGVEVKVSKGVDNKKPQYQPKGINQFARLSIVRVWRYIFPLPENCMATPSPDRSVLFNPPMPLME